MTLQLDKLAYTQIQETPYEHCVVPEFIDPHGLDQLNQDFPEINDPANHSVDKLSYGPAFQALLDQLNHPSFSDMLGEKFDVQLTGYPSTITVRGQCELSDGDIHTDHWTKIVTVLLYFNTEWPHEGGRLRLLNSATDIEDYAVEVNPEGGKMLAFLRSDHSYHGHKRFVGERRILQMNWVKPTRRAQLTQKLDRFLTHTIKRISRFGNRS